MRRMRASTSRLSTRTRPAIAVQQIVLCAKTGFAAHAELAWKWPDGKCSRPASSWRSRIASLTTT